MNRRRFVRSAALAPLASLAGSGFLPWHPLAAAGERSLASGREHATDILVAGGGVGGCAAALAACRAGRSVILLEETDWIGGQFTTQAVPPDEHPWIERFGCTRSYRAFREGVRQYYRDHFPLTTAARALPHLNPGNGWVSRLCHEPRVALAVLHQMLAPHLASGRLRILHHRVVERVETDADRVTAVHSGGQVFHARYVLDATELGDLLPLAGVEHVTGAESRRDTGEPHAPETARPLDQQALTWCFAMDHVQGEDHTIPRPERYGFWRDYVPDMTPPWTGRLLDWANTHPITLEPRTFLFDPTQGTPGTNLFNYRRITDPSLYAPGTHASGVTIVNWPQNDYWLLPIAGPGIGPDTARDALHDARQLSLCLLYWMQTAAPRPDGGTGWPGLRLRDDLTGGPDGLARSVYVRESRRILAEFTLVEQHVATAARMEVTGLPEDRVTAARFDDAVGIGAYRIDLHPGIGGGNYVDLGCLPFQFPMGALIPRRVENLLPACKNAGVTHITNGCCRLHPVEWNIGEAAGALAAFCLSTGETPRAAGNRPGLRARFQQQLRDQGFELEWPVTTPL